MCMCLSGREGGKDGKRTEIPKNTLCTQKQVLVCDCKSETVKLWSSLKFAQNLLHGHLSHWGPGVGWPDAAAMAQAVTAPECSSLPWPGCHCWLCPTQAVHWVLLGSRLPIREKSHCVASPASATLRGPFAKARTDLWSIWALVTYMSSILKSTDLSTYNLWIFLYVCHTAAQIYLKTEWMMSKDTGRNITEKDVVFFSSHPIRWHTILICIITDDGHGDVCPASLP